MARSLSPNESAEARGLIEDAKLMLEHCRRIPGISSRLGRIERNKLQGLILRADEFLAATIGVGKDEDNDA